MLPQGISAIIVSWASEGPMHLSNYFPPVAVWLDYQKKICRKFCTSKTFHTKL